MNNRLSRTINIPLFMMIIISSWLFSASGFVFAQEGAAENKTDSVTTTNQTEDESIPAVRPTVWKGYLADGTMISVEDVKKMLTEHEAWFATDGAKGKRLVLDGANLPYIDLHGAELSESSMRGTFLWRANLSDTSLYRADLTKARLTEANLRGAELYNLHLNYADMQDAKMQNAQFVLANLEHASLRRADLTGAQMFATRLGGAVLNHADLTNCIFDVATLPDVADMTGMRGLKTLRFQPQLELSGAHGLERLRRSFRNAGMNAEADEVSYALWTWANAKPSMKSRLNRTLFGFTCSYGLDSLHPVILWLILTGGFAIIYLIFFVFGATIRTEYHDALNTNDNKTSTKMKSNNPLYHALVYTLQNAFNLGLNNCNLNRIPALIYPTPIQIKTRGLLRTLAGLQTILCIYLLILWLAIITCHPFG